MIKISHLSKKYEHAEPLKDINVTINDGDVISIIGSSGCGKSTLLRCINMLETPTSGKIEIDDVDITNKKNYNSPIKMKMGMVFQSFNLFPNMTVIENLMIPQVRLLKRSKQEAYDKAIKNLHLVGLESKALKYPDSLSGGQKQRVAIARTLSMDPDVILFDEPTSALDPTMVGEVQTIIRELTKLNKTMLIVTHEMRFAKEVSNRILFLDHGVIYDDGTPEEIFDYPQKELTKRFVKRLKVFEDRIENNEFDYQEFILKLSNYGYKNQIDHSIIYKLESCFEELCLEIILPTLNNPMLLFTSEYNDSDNVMMVSILYNGEKLNPMKSDNELSLSIVKGIIKNDKYTQINDSLYTNKFEFELKI